MLLKDSNTVTLSNTDHLRGMTFFARAENPVCLAKE